MPKTASSDLTARLVGKAVAEGRRKAGITQVQLAQRMGVHASYIAGLETGRRNLTVGQLGSVAQALGMRLNVGFEPVPEQQRLVIGRRTSGPERVAQPS
jgi:transcriptional regulator with XRE-family HTH domain